MIEVPLHMLHAMYATALVFPTAGDCVKKAQVHARIACQAVQSDLERANPFTIVTLVHISLFYIKTEVASKVWSLYISQAIQLARNIGLDKDQNIIWLSDRNTAIQFLEMCRSV